MIQYNSINSFKEIHYNGHSIKSVYDYQANKVWPQEIPPTPTNYKWLATYSDSHTESEECDSSSAITWGEVESTNLIDVQIGDCVTVIDDGAFEYCHSLSSVTIPNNVITIGEEAFINCDISYLTIGSGVTSIGISAFKSCQNLSSVTIPNSVITIGNNAFDNCITLTSITMGNSVTSIGNSAFSQCYRLTSVTIPDSVTTIGDYAFYLNWGVRSLTLGSGVTSIGMSAFVGLTQITSLDIPNSVTSIGMGAFYDCTSLTSCTIGSGVTTISDRAFYNFKNISGVTINATTPPTIGTSVFDGKDEDEQEIAYTYPIYVPCDSLADYQTAWSAYANRLQCIPTPTYNRKWFATLSGNVITSGECDSSSALTSNEILIGTNLNVDDIYSVEIGDCVTTLPNSFLNSADRLSSCTIPDTVTSIGTQAFYYCKNLKRINSNADGVFNIPSGITSISDSTFNTCTELTNVTIPNTITSIGNNAFEGCTNLSSMTIPNSVTSIGYQAFRECASLPSITIPDSVQTIDDMAFSYCSGATACTIGSGVTSLLDGTFSYCTRINTFTVNSDAVVSDDYSRKGKMVDFVGSNVKDLIIGEGVTSIGIQAFLYCTSLTSVTIPNSVTSIGNQAFRYSSSLQSITLNATTPPTLGSNVFDSTNDCPIYVPSQSVSAYQTAWSGYSSRIQALT